ncbi:phosphomannomutase [Candidatus Fermentibacteria bacterium]|nr:phosphomannomutase [Candidatus Fermentibacteria bacterium]
MKDSIFRKYDIRGVFPDDLDRQTVRRLGHVLGREAGSCMAVGRDVRDSGIQLLQWISEGAGYAGCRVIDLGVQTTPMTYYAAHILQKPVTVMITGSHNPPEYNGFKVMKGLHTLFGEEIEQLRRKILDASYEGTEESSAEMEKVSLHDGYVERLLSEFCLDRALKVVVDGGNGTGGEVACEVLENLGCRVLPLYCEMDGSFPNHHPDPTVESNLQELISTVVSERADLGIAFDGDADRLGVVDDRGGIVWGDRVLTLLARSVLSEHPGATVISEVKASRLFFDQVEKAGGRPVMSPTGHSIIKQTMQREDALLAGEMSGHIFFRDRYYGYDDALYAALRLIELLGGSERTLSEMLSDLPETLSTPEMREPCREEQKFAIVDIVKRNLKATGFYRVIDVDGVRVEFDEGWALLRASNTQPVLVMRFEADTAERLKEYEQLIRRNVEIAGEELDDQGGS